MTNHNPNMTPAEGEKPWRVEKNANNHWGMREVVGPTLRCIGFTQATNVDYAKARRIEEDAVLIAAAPEMLETLKWVRRNYSSSDWQMVDAALDRVIMLASIP